MDFILDFIGDFLSGIIEPWLANVLKRFKRKGKR